MVPLPENMGEPGLGYPFADRFPIQVLDSINEFILSSRIPSSKYISDGFALGKPAAFQNIGSGATAAYMDLAEELIDKINYLQHQRIVG